jgi:DNA-binding NarL/FixJ family response regulator
MEKDAGRSPSLQRCQAMINAGIGDPESLEGKKFCTENCPYEYCIVFEGYDTRRKKQTSREVKLVGEMLSSGMSIKDIAKELGVTRRTVERRKKEYEHLAN